MIQDAENQALPTGQRPCLPPRSPGPGGGGGGGVCAPDWRDPEVPPHSTPGLVEDPHWSGTGGVGAGALPTALLLAPGPFLSPLPNFL